MRLPRTGLDALETVSLLIVCSFFGISMAAVGRAPLWFWVIVAAPLIPAAFAARRVMSRVRQNLRSGAGRCERCGYNLTGNVSGICPECGRIR